MRKLIISSAGLLLVGTLASASVAQEVWDAAASAELETWLQQGVDGLNRGDMSLMHVTNPEAVGYDLDEQGNPAAFHGPEAVNAFADGFAQMVAQGGTVNIVVTALNCQATSQVGYCTLESDQTFTMGGETLGPLHFRSTIVAAKEGDQWATQHYHGSLAAWPEGMTGAPEEEAPAAP